ncbi:hypothetical protein C8A03DRAFT_34273 [Achaetomium macrosporum]|uniref:Uncharacterized protein n=1 Tax=Achaetomium macrosporum TaxID=79813 RepID=A0AAN7C993_9PEZI|nr:hypothetical protein C8A03DRAFT_34273 [Achaetomium macrosporum]
MVGGSKVLLSIAVLSGLGFDNVVAGRLRRQDGTANSVQSAPGGASSSTSSQPEVVVSLSLSTAVTTVATSSGDQAGSGGSAGGEATSRNLISQVVSVSSGASSVTTQADTGVSTSAAEESVNPGESSTGGTLTGDARAPTQTAESTKPSVEPSSETEREPPPTDTSASTTSASTPSASPIADDSGYNYGPATTVAQSPTVAAPAPGRTPLRGGPPGGKPSSVQMVKGTSESVDLGYGTTTPAPAPSGDVAGPNQTTFVTSTLYANQTFTYMPSGSVSYCQSSDLTVAPTSWSVVHTTTITWYGDPDDYTQPYPPISIPEPTSSCVVPESPPVWTISVCASTGTDSKYRTCDVTTTADSSYSYGFGIQTSIVPAITFITTDKNPAVVFTTIKTPNYGVSQEAKTRDNHASPTANGAISTPVYNSQNPPPQSISDSAQRPPPTPTPITVAVQPTAVVINGNTIRDNPAQQTQVVIIAGQTFTINPTQVIGAGTSIDRPSATGGVYQPTPTSTNLGGVPVVVSSSVAVIGDTTFTLGPTPTTATVSGQTFTIGASTIAGGPSSQTLLLPTLPSPTEVVVAGGDLITAIGSSVVVIHGTTLTYTLSSTPTTTTLDYNNDNDDGDNVVLTLGPGGVTVGTTVIGGTHASSPHDTQYALVGGATLTKIGASVVVVGGSTYTLPGPTTVVVTVGGETVTIVPTGVEVGSLTMRYPFGPTTVITPTPGAGVGGGASAMATSTGVAGTGSGRSGQEEEEDVAGVVRPWLVGVVWAAGVAVGVGVVA